jgi:hypothetical protein
MIIHFLEPVNVDEGQAAAIEFLQESADDIKAVAAIDMPTEPHILSLLLPGTKQVYVCYTPEPFYFCETTEPGLAKYYIETPDGIFTRDTLLEIWQIARQS